MTPTRPVPAARTRIVIDARVGACTGRGMGMTGLRRLAAFYSGLPRAA